MYKTNRLTYLKDFEGGNIYHTVYPKKRHRGRGYVSHSSRPTGRGYASHTGNKETVTQKSIFIIPFYNTIKSALVLLLEVYFRE